MHVSGGPAGSVSAHPGAAAVWRDAEQAHTARTLSHVRHEAYSLCDTQQTYSLLWYTGETNVMYMEYTLSCDTHRAWGEREYTSQYRQVIQPLVPKTVSGLQKDPQQQSVLYRICLHMSVYVCYLSDSLSNSYLEKRRYVFRAVITVRCETRLNFQQSLQSRTLSVLVGQQT